MHCYSVAALAEIRRICQDCGVLFIADEVMTGFGRTGSLFACEQAAATPDIVCLAKGLPGGSLPLAATLCTAEIFDAHVSNDRARMLFHSSSYTANPIACVAAAANLEIWRIEPVRERVRELAKMQAAALAQVQIDPRFRAIRQCGTIAAFDLATDTGGYLADVALPLRVACLKRGVLMRPLGATIYVMPPYCTTEQDLDNVYAAISDAVDEVGV